VVVGVSISGYRAAAESRQVSPPLAKVAVVDLFRVLAEAKPFVAEQDEIRRWIEAEKRTNLDVKKGEIAAKEAELEVFDRASPEYRKLANQLDFDKLGFEHEFQRLERERVRRITDSQRRAFAEATRVVADYAKSQGVTLVLQLRTGELRGEAQSELTSEMYLRDVLYHDASLDITSAVLRILDAKR